MWNVVQDINYFQCNKNNAAMNNNYKIIQPFGLLEYSDNIVHLNCPVSRPEVRVRGTSQQAESEIWQQQGSIHYCSPSLHIRKVISVGAA